MFGPHLGDWGNFQPKLHCDLWTNFFIRINFRHHYNFRKFRRNYYTKDKMVSKIVHEIQSSGSCAGQSKLLTFHPRAQVYELFVYFLSYQKTPKNFRNVYNLLFKFAIFIDKQVYASQISPIQFDFVFSIAEVQIPMPMSI